MSGLAVLDAAKKLRDRIDAVAEELEIPLDQVPQRLSEIASAFWLRNLDPAVEGWAQTEPVSWDPETGSSRVDQYSSGKSESQLKVMTRDELAVSQIPADSIARMKGNIR